jgi:hypothetical protein
VALRLRGKPETGGDTRNWADHGQRAVGLGCRWDELRERTTTFLLTRVTTSTAFSRRPLGNPTAGRWLFQAAAWAGEQEHCRRHTSEQERTKGLGPAGARPNIPARLCVNYANPVVELVDGMAEKSGKESIRRLHRQALSDGETGQTMIVKIWPRHCILECEALIRTRSADSIRDRGKGLLLGQDV